MTDQEILKVFVKLFKMAEDLLVLHWLLVDESLLIYLLCPFLLIHKKLMNQRVWPVAYFL